MEVAVTRPAAEVLGTTTGIVELALGTGWKLGLELPLSRS